MPLLKIRSIMSTTLTLSVFLILTAACRSGADVASAERKTYTTDHGKIRVVTVADGLNYPWSLAFLPDGRMLVTERPGSLRIVEQNGRIAEPLAGVPEVYTNGQGGLLDVALDPEFSANRYVYFSYAEEDGNGAAGTAVGRGRLTESGLDGYTVLFRQEPKTWSTVHFGSRLVHSRDGKLFITLGDRGERDRVQDFSVHRGQVVRINPDGTVPADNPFTGRDRYRLETWSHGHRNPQGAALHPETGEIWTVEHGARGGDEVNIPRAGRNYGWPVISYGTHYSGLPIGVGTEKEDMEQPVYYWDPSIAPSGMAFYTGERFPRWKGNLFVGALRGQMLVRLELDGEKVVKEERLLTELGERIRDVRQGPDGCLYLLTDSGNGRILKLEPVQ